ncbi:uncharacterized protein LOC123379535 [Felis catus]|uniref:uncharacterized protein LOC123379535 n=1 Tax=Felis catus TaxID=9685 RepID=UPI001D19FC61|nr:uncharacterized protein LOC123379535 [Felis catus]
MAIGHITEQLVNRKSVNLIQFEYSDKLNAMPLRDINRIPDVGVDNGCQSQTYRQSALQRRKANSSAGIVLRMPCRGGKSRQVAPALWVDFTPPPRPRYRFRESWRNGVAVPDPALLSRIPAETTLVESYVQGRNRHHQCGPAGLRRLCLGYLNEGQVLSRTLGHRGAGVEVLYFAKSAEIAGIRSETISVPQEIKALQLWNEIEARHPG